MKTLLFVLLPALALAGTASADDHRAGVLIIPANRDAEAETLKLEVFLGEALSQFRGVAVSRPDELWGTPQDSAAAASLKRAQKSYNAGVKAYRTKDLA